MSSTKWVKRKLGDMVQFKTGKLNSNAASADGLYPFFTCSRETFRTDTYSFDTEAVLLAGNNASGVYPLKYFKGKFDAYQRTYVITTLDPDTITNRFLYYVLQPQLERLQTLSTGVATKFLTLTILKSLEVSIPPLHEQQRVTSILSAYDDLIENNTRRIEILEEMARRLYEEWFVHFRFPGHEEVSFKESELGRIPDEWGTEAATDAFKIKYGKTFPKKNLDPSGQYPVFGGGGVIGRCDQFNIDGPTTLITSRGNGSGTVWRASEAGLVTNNAFTVMPKDSKLNTHYGYIEQVMLNASVMSVVGGAAQPQLTLDGLSGVRVMTPDPKVVDQFSLLVDPLYALVNRLQRKNANLRVQRDLLLPKLVSGEIDVSNISMPNDKEVEAA
ncbi:MAG: restriction endonuclease subunit S [Alteromonadaceae bacterium]|uniref:restriction endonuclease subunit S n=1 Tax=Marinobacter sp. TaxID=50741 RepID=UPI0029C33F7F|nr:restriction endonuclease subunit S [Marinobacter sp.]MDX5385487.1 restriction endonuclease subunit S [Marinobacter sp.]MDX5440347.1 restriction endonuclease subunit S [Alteromonadaceae bacterium]MDX5471119.1 restriction endonuclease subunit S [Marinobacter sp.]